MIKNCLVLLSASLSRSCYVRTSPFVTSTPNFRFFATVATTTTPTPTPTISKLTFPTPKESIEEKDENNRLFNLAFDIKKALRDNKKEVRKARQKKEQPKLLQATDLASVDDLRKIASLAIKKSVITYGPTGVVRQASLSGRVFADIKKLIIGAGLEWPQKEEDELKAKVYYNRNTDPNIDAKYKNRTHVPAKFKTHKKYRNRAEKFQTIALNLQKMPEMIKKVNEEKKELRRKKREKLNILNF